MPITCQAIIFGIHRTSALHTCGITGVFIMLGDILCLVEADTLASPSIAATLTIALEHAIASVEI